MKIIPEECSVLALENDRQSHYRKSKSVVKDEEPPSQLQIDTYISNSIGDQPIISVLDEKHHKLLLVKIWHSQNVIRLIHILTWCPHIGIYGRRTPDPENWSYIVRGYYHGYYYYHDLFSRLGNDWQSVFLVSVL